jgi:hypothetical protein
MRSDLDDRCDVLFSELGGESFDEPGAEACIVGVFWARGRTGKTLDVTSASAARVSRVRFGVMSAPP